jgi:malate dehydrogenase (oxaloacetate-decarboxylating)
MKLAAAKALASLVPDDRLDEDFILPEPFDKRCAEAVSKAVEECITPENTLEIL